MTRNAKTLKPEAQPRARQIHFADRMSESDAVMWRIESDPQLRSTITAVWTLDGSPDWRRFERKLERCTVDVPRLRQKVVSDPLGLAPPSWESDPHFDLGFHFRRVSAPGEGTLRDLMTLAQPIAMQGFDRDRPLWELTRVDGLEGGRVGLILKLHHAISDGVGLVRMTEGLVERGPEPQPHDDISFAKQPEVETPTDWQRTRDAVEFGVRTGFGRAASVTRALAEGIGRAAREPVALGESIRDGASSLVRLLAPVSEPMSPVLRGRSLSVAFDVIELPLEDLKRASRAVGGTLNDAFVSVVAGGLRHYHEALGMPVDALRMNMPINMREGEAGNDAGNQFAPVRFAVPISTVDPAERMLQIHDLVIEQRAEPALSWLEPISAAIGSLPGGGAASFAGSMMKAIDFTTSNVPGPRFPVYVSGARVERMFGFGPLAGAAINITCFSYDGTLAFSINMDPAAVEDPGLFGECMRKGLDEVLAVV